MIETTAMTVTPMSNRADRTLGFAGCGARSGSSGGEITFSAGFCRGFHAADSASANSRHVGYRRAGCLAIPFSSTALTA